MAARFWVGGTGNWNNSNTSNWSSTSGGGSGASVPTASDNVTFDANSNTGANNFTVTLVNNPRVCNNFTASGLDGTMTLAGSGIGLTVSGNLTFQATNFTRTYTGTTTFNATTTGKTVTTNGNAFGGGVVFDGVGGGWTLGSALTTSGTITLTNGTFSTSASNYAVTANNFSSSNSNVRTITLNASLVTVNSNGTPWNMGTSTNATLNAGTSTIDLTNSSPAFAGGGLTYYRVEFSFPSYTTAIRTISGTNTFSVLYFEGQNSEGLYEVNFSANQTINTSLTVVAGANTACRIQLSSDVFGTARTLTCAGTNLTNTDFRDITIAGAASPASGTRLGDAKGNSGITFPAAKTVYYRATGSANWGVSSTGAWSATSGGALDETMFPLAQDTAIFPAATYPASGSTITINANYNIGTIDMSLRTTNTMTLATGTTTPFIYGDWINGTGITLSGTGTITFASRTTQSIVDSPSNSFIYPVNINAFGGTVVIVGNIQFDTFTLNYGTLDLTGVSSFLNVYSFNSSNTNTRAILFGTNALQVVAFTATTVWDTSVVTNMTTSSSATYDVQISAYVSGITVNTGNLPENYAISFLILPGGPGLSCTFLGSAGDTAKNVEIGEININAIGACKIFGDFVADPLTTFTASGNAMTFGATSGTKTIVTNAVALNFPITFNGVGGTFQLLDALTMGSTRTATLTNGTLNLNGFTYTVGTAFTTATGTKNLTFNGGTLVCPAATTTAFNNAVPTGFTTTAGTGTGAISMTAATAKTFVGGGSTFNCTLNQGGAGALTITGSNTFSNITNTVQPASVLFTAATTNTFTNFNLSGTSGNLITIGSVTAASHTLSKASGTVSVSFCSISRSNGTGGATWEAFTTNGNVDGGNNSGWLFTPNNSNFLVFF